jgi:hypothetical protein
LITGIGAADLPFETASWGLSGRTISLKTRCLAQQSQNTLGLPGPPLVTNNVKSVSVPNIECWPPLLTRCPSWSISEGAPYELDDDLHRFRKIQFR